MNRQADLLSSPLSTTPKPPSSRPVVESVHVGYMTVPQAAKYLNVSKSTVRRLIKVHALPHYYVPCVAGKGERGKLLFRRGELDRWMRRFRNGLQAHEGTGGAALDGHEVAADAISG